MGKNKDPKYKKEFDLECEEYLRKKMERCSEFEKKIMQELVDNYGLWVSVEKAKSILGKSRSTIYKYKENNSFIYRQSERKIMIYTKSLIFVL